jgi:hypothetical protein
MQLIFRCLTLSLIALATLVSMSVKRVLAQATFQAVAIRGPAVGVQGGTWTSFDTHPSIDDFGRVGFQASLLNSGSINSTNNLGLWFGVPGGLSLVSRTGTPVPGDSAGRAFLSNISFFNTTAQGGEMRFRSDFRRSDGTTASGNWRPIANAPQLLVESGSSAPDVPGAFFRPPFDGQAVSNFAGDFAFRGFLNGSAINSTNDHGIWVHTGDATRLMVQSGAHAPGTPVGAVFSTFSWYSMSPADGKVAVRANLVTGSGGVNDNNNSGFWEYANGQTSLLLRGGDPAPGMPMGTTLTYPTAQPRYNGHGALMLNIGIADSNPGSHTALYTYDSGGPHLLAYAGENVPGAGVIQETHPCRLTDDGRVVADVYLDNGHNAVIIASPGSAQLVATPGMEAPEMPGGTTFSYISSPGANARGQLFFLADTRDAANHLVTGTLFATDPTGVLHRIVGPGSTIEIAPGSFKTVAGGIATYSTTYSDVANQDFNSTGQLVFTAGFTDGTSGVIIATIPEPGFLGVVTVVVALFPRRRHQIAAACGDGPAN